MRKDSPDLDPGPVTPNAAERRPSTGSRLARALPIAAWVLVFGTSAAVASLSWWLVPPYLGLMGLLLFEPAGRRVNATNPTGPESATSGEPSPGVAIDPVDVAGSTMEGPEAEGRDASPTDRSPDVPSTAVKARRGTKGRARKARPVVEPAPATWVQVAPGKFVRVEPGVDAGSGPHEPPTELEVRTSDVSPEPSSPSDVPGFPLDFADPEHGDDAPPPVPQDLDDRPIAATEVEPSDVDESAEAIEGPPPEITEPGFADPSDTADRFAADPSDDGEAPADLSEDFRVEFVNVWAGEAGASDPDPRSAEPKPFRLRRDPPHGLTTPYPSSGRSVRGAVGGRLPTGYRRRSKRGDGRSHHLARAFPPRSPPDRRSFADRT